MLTITYQYKESIRTMSYDDEKIFLSSQMSCTLDVPTFYTVKKVVLNGVEIPALEHRTQDEVYEYFMEQQKNEGTK